MNTKQDRLYMDLAIRVSQESYCVRKQVGAVLVTPDLVTLVGYNGSVSGAPNVCELEDGTTDPEVLHAETNVFSKALNAGVSTKAATLYITCSPCLDCSKIIKQSGVCRVVYLEQYRCTRGVDFLVKHGIVVEKMKEETND